MTQFADIMTIAEMTPGPIAINSATFVGIRVAGIPGALVATIGCVLPSCLIVLLLAFLYYRLKGLSLVQGVLFGLRPAVIAMIASAGLSLLLLSLGGGVSLLEGGALDPVALLIFCGGLAVLRVWKVNPIWVMMGAGAVGLVLYTALRGGAL